MITLAQGVPDAPALVPSAPTPAAPGSSLVPMDSGLGTLEAFVGTPIFETVQAIASTTGIGVMVLVVFYVIKNILGGMVGFAVKTAVFGSVVAAMLFNLRVPIAFASGLTSIVSGVFEFLLGILGGS